MTENILNVKNLMSNIFEQLNIDAESVVSLLSEQTPLISEITNIDEKLLSAIFKIVPVLLSGELDIKSLIPSLIPVAISYFLSLKSGKANENAPENIGGALKDNVSVGDDNGFQNVFSFDGKKGFSPIDLYLQNSNPS